MADGANANVGFGSWLLFGRELTFKTGVTATAQLDFKSAKFSNKKDSKIIEAVRNSRTMVDRIGLGRVVEGEVEYHMSSDNEAGVYLLHNAMGGGTVAMATAAGDTVGAGVIDHVFSVNGFDATYSSLCINHRKGNTTHGKIFDYVGARVDELSLKAALDEPLMASAKMIMCDVTTGADLSALLTTTSGQTPLSFVNMSFSVENTFASITAGSFWHVQSFDWKVSNSLKGDSDSRRIGSDVLQVLPPGVASFELSCSMRFDTLTAYNAMLNETQMAGQLIFQGATITGSKMPMLIKIDMPRLFVQDSGDPEIGGPDEVLKANVKFMVLQDDSTSTGYACKATVRNKTTSYN